MSNTNYGSNYNKIFQNNGLKLDKLIPAINKLDIYSNNDSQTDFKDVNNMFFQNDTVFNDIGHYGFGNASFFSHQSNKTSNIADFNILQSSSFLSQNGRESFFD